MALWLGLATISIAYVLFTWGLSGLTAATAATLTLGEPLTASILGIVVLDERPQRPRDRRAGRARPRASPCSPGARGPRATPARSPWRADDGASRSASTTSPGRRHARSSPAISTACTTRRRRRACTLSTSDGLRHPADHVLVGLDRRRPRRDRRAAAIDAERGELKSMRVDDRFLRHCGVGRAILRHIVAEARARGMTSLWLETGVDRRLPARPAAL